MKYRIYTAGIALLLAACNNPAPNQTETVTDSTEQKIDSLMELMTVEEKVNMLHASSSFTSGGVPRLGIPEMTTSDGPHGVRMEHGRDWTTENDHVNDSGTYLPTGNLLAATWNPDMGHEFGKVLGSEANARGKDVILGPGINIIRTPLNGRNFEYLSEDPYLVAHMVVNTIKGIQEQGISACVKHYAANNQEKWRDSVDVIMDERTLREIYLPGFEAAVTLGKVNTVMGAYNRFRGQYCTHNKYLVMDVLKGEWKFDGLLMSDWGAVHNTLEAVENGTDLEMGTELRTAPSYNKFFMADTLVALIKAGTIKEEAINDKVRRILRIMYRTHMIGSEKRQPGSFATTQHQQTALKIAEEGIVLLKNNNQALPLKKGIRTIAVIGENAARKNAGGGGSSQVKPTYEITPLEGLKKSAGNDVAITYARGYTIVRDAKANTQLINEAVAAAKNADAAILFCGWTHGYNYNVWKDNAYDAEDTDKPSLDMPFGQNELIKAVLKANPHTVIVLMGGGPIDISQWANDAPAIVEAWYPGMEGGNAIANVLWGKVNPSGKLPMTFPVKLADCPDQKLGEYPGKNLTVHYKEGIFAGYRYYEHYNVTPMFPFGHGLSYTCFAYSDLKIMLGKDSTTVTLKLKNTGTVTGAEVVQLYVEDVASALPRPKKELKAFEKVQLNAGEEQTVRLVLDTRAFSYYNDQQKKWVLEPGVFVLHVGSSSADIRLKGEMKL